MFWAKKGDLEFLAEDTVALLGLIEIHEVRGDGWQAAGHEIDSYMTFDKS